MYDRDNLRIYAFYELGVEVYASGLARVKMKDMKSLTLESKFFNRDQQTEPVGQSIDRSLSIKLRSHNETMILGG